MRARFSHLDPSRSILTPQDAAAFPLLQPGRVPAGHLVLLGDNRESSLDSRRVGYFPTTRVLGIALLARHPTGTLTHAPPEKAVSPNR
ncbi:S26 family signal peptidase [Streptomyces sp. Ac-502]|uniref:S26 family signal peptidase n=1 Tax=Streptomyces sp. Ac-502 TaxID=3342801 RepID=UPI003862CB50